MVTASSVTEIHPAGPVPPNRVPRLPERRGRGRRGNGPGAVADGHRLFDDWPGLGRGGPVRQCLAQVGQRKGEGRSVPGSGLAVDQVPVDVDASATGKASPPAAQLPQPAARLVSELARSAEGSELAGASSRRVRTASSWCGHCVGRAAQPATTRCRECRVRRPQQVGNGRFGSNQLAADGQCFLGSLGEGLRWAAPSSKQLPRPGRRGTG